MIVRPKPSTLSLFFILRGSIVPTIAPKLLSMAGFTLLIAAVHHVRPGWLGEVPLAPFTLLGLSLSIFLGFRNNACYDRWWEARKLLGQLVYEMRILARETVLLMPGPEAATSREKIMRTLIAFTHALTARLRGADSVAAAGEWISQAPAAEIHSRRNVPDALVTVAGQEYAQALREGRLSDILYQSLSSRLSALSGVQAGCERIWATPLPFAYSLLLHRTAMLFCILLPFALVGPLGWFAPVVEAIVAYAFFGLDALGDELEDPFGTAPNDLPLEAITRSIEIDLLEGFGSRDVPPPMQPEDYVLR